MYKEDRIIQFVERELTPEEERAVLDECSTSDEMRGLLKQHVSLSRNVAAALSAVSVPASAEQRLGERIATLRNPVATGGTSRGVRIGGIAAVLTGAAAALMTAVMLVTPRTPVAQNEMAALPIVAPVQTPATVDVSPAPAPSASNPVSVHRRPRRRSVNEPAQIVEKTTKSATANANQKSKRAPRKLILDEGDKVK